MTSELQGLSGAAQAAGGDWAKLSAGDQAKFVARAGSEAEARKMVAQMASKPGSRGGK